MHLMIVFPGLCPPRAGAADCELRVRHDPRDPRPGRHLHPLKLPRSLDPISSARHFSFSPSLPRPDNSIPNAFQVVRFTFSLLFGNNISSFIYMSQLFS